LPDPPLVLIPANIRTFITCAIALCVRSFALQAQTAETAPDSGRVAIVVFAAASAKEVRFNTQPELRVTLKGGIDSVHVLERRNLPSPVVVGTTYKDVYVAVQIFGRLNAECISQTLTGNKPRMDCAALELHGATRPPADTTKPPRS